MAQSASVLQFLATQIAEELHHSFAAHCADSRQPGRHFVTGNHQFRLSTAQISPRWQSESTSQRAPSPAASALQAASSRAPKPCASVSLKIVMPSEKQISDRPVVLGHRYGMRESRVAALLFLRNPMHKCAELYAGQGWRSESGQAWRSFELVGHEIGVQLIGIGDAHSMA